MAKACIICGATTRLQDSHRTTTGRRRRFYCLGPACGHRWTEWEGGRPSPPPPVLSASEQATLAVRLPRLTDAQVRLVLTRMDISARRLGPMLGRSYQAINYIRLGRSYATVAPELPRLQPGEAQRSCLICRHWRDDACGWGFPDPLTDGHIFARECEEFAARQP